MWDKEYKDYPRDTPLKKCRLEPGKGFSGCEMGDVNGWGETYHVAPRPKKRGLFYTLLTSIFGSSKEKN